MSISLPAFSELVWAKVEVTLAEQAIHSARLLAGEIPHDLGEVFLAAGAPLFPQRAQDLALSCSCPDWEVPCKHLAAPFYLLAESFDDDPFAILLWRGRSHKALLDRLRELRGGDTGPLAVEPAALTAEGPRVGAMMALADLALVEGDFWTGAPVPGAACPGVASDEPASAPAPRAGSVPWWPDFVAYLARLYAAFGELPD